MERISGFSPTVAYPNRELKQFELTSYNCHMLCKAPAKPHARLYPLQSAREAACALYEVLMKSGR